MTYRTQAILAQDFDLQQRVQACAATQGVGAVPDWAAEHMWSLSASPGWDDAYASALEAGVEAPGDSEAVITDAMILAAVQLLATAGGA
ncbi:MULTISPECIES: hypothetical protein [unclassified Leucobacter]|uniref:hypothetical protein n=1 Tax=unclassified Leucobacter TaxID=2621730 RepID=UPI000620F041|nr:hypothetical protein [Leucobacter sp. Ag1]KKI16366.1 hypothetical protein XM48_16345 [Leucobacter sp. Ag1]